MKKNKNKTLIIIVVIAVIVAAVAFYFLKFYTPKTDKDAEGGSSGSGTNLVKRNDNFPLQFGSLGARVKMLQQWLNYFYINADIDSPLWGKALVVDGDFGTKTEAALKGKIKRNFVTSDEYYKYIDGLHQNYNG